MDQIRMNLIIEMETHGGCEVFNGRLHGWWVGLMLQEINTRISVVDFG